MRPGRLAAFVVEARPTADAATQCHGSVEVEPLRDLMSRYARGEDAVFEPLYGLLAPRLRRFCRRLATNAAEADDLFQETFLRVHRARATYLHGARVVPWVFAIARSVHQDRLKYWRSRPEHLGLVHDVAENEGALGARERHGPEAHALAHGMLRVVTAALDRMSDKNRVAYALVREEGLSVKEAAAVLGTTPDVVKQRAHRAAGHLKAALRAAGWRESSDERSSDTEPAEI